ncbi:MAG TPA: RNA polymerase sigma factor [Candidatus Angelobacter sp.]|jgi:RNA polymerase sigma-70 factor (ECF subfamily)
MTDFLKVYESYAPMVRRFALFLCGNPALADDITSETFIRVWRSEGKIRESSVKAYLFTIARNLYRDYLRSVKHTVPLDESTPDLGQGLQIQMEQKAEVRAVMVALQELSEIDRAALLMRVQEEMSYEEIAQVLKIPLSSTKVKVHRARLKLMKARGTFHEVRS